MRQLKHSLATVDTANLIEAQSVEGDSLFLDVETVEVLTEEGEEELTNVRAIDSDFKSESFLTSDQSAALEMMKQFVQTPRQKYFRLTGYAGTGKSYLIVQLMKWLLNQRINFVAGSPTKQRVAQIVV